MHNHPSSMQTLSYSGSKNQSIKRDNHPYEEKASTLQVSSMMPDRNPSPLHALNEDQLARNYRNFES